LKDLEISNLGKGENTRKRVPKETVWWGKEEGPCSEAGKEEDLSERSS